MKKKKEQVIVTVHKCPYKKDGSVLICAFCPRFCMGRGEVKNE